jgi:phage anti-repressor protein
MGRCCTSGSEDNEDNGRDLWEGLDIGRDYTNWVKDQVVSLQLIENEDYIIFAEKGENPGRPRKEVAFTLDAAKHIAMASRTEKGREVRLPPNRGLSPARQAALALQRTWGDSTGIMACIPSKQAVKCGF